MTNETFLIEVYNCIEREIVYFVPSFPNEEHGVKKMFETFFGTLFLAVIYCTFNRIDIFCERSVEQLCIQENQ